MKVPTGEFFSGSGRRVPLSRMRRAEPVRSESATGLTMDCEVPSATRRSRLVAYHDDEGDYVALVVGDADGVDDVAVHAVPEEHLILEGGRSRALVEILVGVPEGSDLGVQQRELDRQLFIGGPLRSMLEYSGARSVVVGGTGPL